MGQRGHSTAEVAPDCRCVPRLHHVLSAGWLRPTVFGAVDGLVTSASLIAGLAGGGASRHAVVLAGLAALVAGAFSMSTGEYVSVLSQNELTRAEDGRRTRGLPSALLAAASSLCAFSLGAALPLAPWLAGLASLGASLAVAGLTLAAGGAAVGILTERPPLLSAARQLGLGSLAISVTYLAGALIGAAAA